MWTKNFGKKMKLRGNRRKNPNEIVERLHEIIEGYIKWKKKIWGRRWGHVWERETTKLSQ